MKDNFLLKKCQYEIFESLSDEDAGKLIKGIFNYANTGESKLDGLLKTIFIPIKNEIDKNEENYQKRCEKNKENVAKRWNKEEEENIPKDTIVSSGKEKSKSDTNEYQGIPKDTDNNHISYITNHKSYNQDLKEIGYGEEETLDNTDNPSSLGEMTKEILEYLNLKTKSNFRYTSKATQSKIQARLNEKYVIDDFKKVIDNKCNEWLGTEWEKYLNPETLFGTKFEKYLNQKVVKPKAKEIKRDKTMDVLRGVYDGSIKIN